MTLVQNPLNDYKEFVPYKNIQAEHIVAAVKTAINLSQQRLEEILAHYEKNLESSKTGKFLYDFIEMSKPLDKVWTPVENLLGLMGTKEIRAAAEEARPLVVEFYNNYSLDPRVYNLVKKYSQTQEAKNLTGELKRHLENTLIDFKLAGAELEGPEKEEFKKLNLELADLTQKFSDNATDSKFELIITNASDLQGLPEDAINDAKHKADEMREAGAKIPEGAFIFNLDYPSYGPFIKYADNGALRKQLYLQYLKQGTAEATGGLLDNGSNTKSLDNTELINQIFAARLRKAQLLGFKNYAELSLETKMAPSPQKVTEFLERLGAKARPLAEREYAELVAFQKSINYRNTENNPEKIYPWDKDYLSEKLRKEKYAFDTNIVKPYFELSNTIEGMFNIAKTLFSIDIQKISNLEVWHEDVEVYEIHDKESQNKIGTFYMDLYPRDIKHQGAWVMPLVAACVNGDGSKTLPQCALVCNLTKPRTGSPSLLNHMEVTTLFHEFGHALHHLLSKVEVEPLSGTNVEWDFVELPSQLNENFTWEKSSLETFAKHHQTQEAIPNTLLDKMLKARNFNEGLACLRQIEFGLFDLAVYTRSDTGGKTVLEIFKDIVAKYGLFPVIEGTNFPCAFSHIFAGGYAAGYYSYKWAEVLEADAFSRFQEAGVLNAEVGKEYRETILAMGDSKAPMDLFVKFMGREPNEDALLERMGL